MTGIPDYQRQTLISDADSANLQRIADILNAKRGTIFRAKQALTGASSATMYTVPSDKVAYLTNCMISTGAPPADGYCVLSIVDTLGVTFHRLGHFNHIAAAGTSFIVSPTYINPIYVPSSYEFQFDQNQGFDSYAMVYGYLEDA